MALKVTSIEQGTWTWEDLAREVVAVLHDQVGGAAGTSGNAVRLMHVADSQEEYFSASNPFTTVHDLARKLVGIDGDNRPAVRVCIGTGGVNYVAAAVALLPNLTTAKLALSCIGKATDDGPMVRIAIANDPNV